LRGPAGALGRVSAIWYRGPCRHLLPEPMPRKFSNKSLASLLKAPTRASSPGAEADKALVSAATREAYKRVKLLLEACFEDFSPAQQRKIRGSIGASATSKPPKRAKAARAQKEGLTPRFWLPFSGETWSGRGRPPGAFLAWEGTVAHTEWKKRHPDVRFPAYPG